MKIAVFQIKSELDKNKMKFENLDFVKAKQGGVDPAIYEKVFEGNIDCKNLEIVYTMFNSADTPITHRGHSMSVGDVIKVADHPKTVGVIDYLYKATDGTTKIGETCEYTNIEQYNADIADSIDCGRPFQKRDAFESSKDGFYFCDSFGFAKIDFDENKISQSENLIKVVVIEPNKAPYTAEIENHFKAMQRILGGLIECTYPFEDDTVVFSNEESKLNGMDGNRTINGELYAGPLFIARDMPGGETGSLTESQIEKYLDRFKEIESYTQDDVQDSIHMEFYSF
jgi:hypothetical protein